MNILEKNPDKLHVLFISEILELHTFFDALFPSGSPYQDIYILIIFASQAFVIRPLSTNVVA